MNKKSDEVSDQEIVEEIRLREGRNTFNELDYSIKEKEIRLVIIGLRPVKAVGLDSIKNEMIKASIDVLCTPLVVIFNEMLVKVVFPKMWNSGYIKCLLKSGSKSNPTNYRGINMCSNLKVFTGVMLNRLNTFLDKHNIMKQEQIGFKKRARTADHMFILKTLIDKYTNKKGGQLYACFVDLSKAFDTVWGTGLLVKLLRHEVGGKFYGVIKAMHEQVKSCVKTSSGFSQLLECTLGVKQGEVLSPILFYLYINDLPDIFGSECDPVEINKHTLNTFMYADDIILLSKSKQGLQNCLNNCTKWKLNTLKSKIIVFNKTRRMSHTIFKYGKSNVECVKSYKHLGIEFLIADNFTEAKCVLRKKAKKSTFILKSFINNQHLSPTVTLSMFKKLIVPIRTYGSEIWGAYYNTNM